MRANAKRLWPLILMAWLMLALTFGPTFKGLHAQTTTHGVMLTWTAPTSAGTNAGGAAATITGYSVLRGTTSGGESSTPIATGITTTSYLDTTAVSGTTYYYEITATNSANLTSGPSNEMSIDFLVPGTAPAAPVLGAARSQ